MALVPTMRPNPLRFDPTRTTTLRRQFMSELGKRYDRLKGAVLQLLVYEDAFDIKKRRKNPVTDIVVVHARFAFASQSEQVEGFRNWFANELDTGVLPTEDAYWEKYSQRGYEKGAGRAFDDTNTARRAKLGGTRQMDFYAGSREQFLASSFAQPVSIDKVKLLAGRTFMDLKGANDAMATATRRALTDGLVQGQSPLVIARDLNKAIDVGKRRAQTIARTEVIRAHAEGQLTALEAMGVDKVGVMVEWSTAGDIDVCVLCGPLEGTVLKLKEATGVIPRHPNCRCSFIPANVGEPTTGQKRTKPQVDKAMTDSIRAEMPKRSKRTLAEQRRRSNWGGAKKQVAKKRPTSILSKTGRAKRTVQRHVVGKPGSVPWKVTQALSDKVSRTIPQMAELSGVPEARIRQAMKFRMKEGTVLQKGDRFIMTPGNKPIKGLNPPGATVPKPTKKGTAKPTPKKSAKKHTPHTSGVVEPPKLPDGPQLPKPTPKKKWGPEKKTGKKAPEGFGQKHPKPKKAPKKTYPKKKAPPEHTEVKKAPKKTYTDKEMHTLRQKMNAPFTKSFVTDVGGKNVSSVRRIVHEQLQAIKNAIAPGKRVQRPVTVRFTKGNPAKNAEGVYRRSMSSGDSQLIARVGGRLGDDVLEFGAHSIGDEFTLASTLRHEYGHHFWYERVGFADHQEWGRIFNSEIKGFWHRYISKYGATAPEELFAESFCAYTHPSYRAGMMPKRVEDFMAKVTGKKPKKLAPKAKLEQAKAKTAKAKKHLADTKKATAKAQKEIDDLGAPMKKRK